MPTDNAASVPLWQAIINAWKGCRMPTVREYAGRGQSVGAGKFSFRITRKSWEKP